MSELQVTFLELPIIGKPVKFWLDGQVSQTLNTISVSSDECDSQMLHVTTSGGISYSGRVETEHSEVSLAHTGTRVQSKSGSSKLPKFLLIAGIIVFLVGTLIECGFISLYRTNIDFYMSNNADPIFASSIHNYFDYAEWMREWATYFWIVPLSGLVMAVIGKRKGGSLRGK